MSFTKKIITISLAISSALAIAQNTQINNKPTNKVPSSQIKHGLSPNATEQILAVVDDEVITMADFASRLNSLRISGQSLPDEAVLQSLIDEKLLNSYADNLGIKVSDQRVAQAIQNIAAQNGLTPEQMKQASSQYNIVWDDYIKNIRQQIKIEDLKVAVVRDRINITPHDIEAYLAQNPTGLPKGYKAPVKFEPRFEKRQVVEQYFVPKAIALQHIYIRVPEGSSPDEVAAAKAKADEALSKIRRGQKFDDIARQYSDGPAAANGGKLGIRMNEDWPTLFVNATKNVRDGHTTGVFKAANGFHILKVVERRGLVDQRVKTVNVRLPDPPQPQLTEKEKAAKQEGPVQVEESHVRHILVAFNPVVDVQKAYEKILDIQKQLQAGAEFSELAEKYSDDTSAPVGGDISWIMRGTADPAFEQAAFNLPLNQVSEPIRTKFGWHLIEVLERRNLNRKAEIRKDLAYEMLYQQQSVSILEDWLNQLRSQSYIENRLTGYKSGQ